MSIAESPGSAAPPRRVHDRDTDLTAPARCGCYAAWSELTASPHDLDPRPGLQEKLGIWDAIPHAQSLSKLISEFVEVDLLILQREYSGLFEVGSDGPPVPIREDLQTGQRAGTREDLVRFYNYFGYQLAERFAWAPDHLSVELEFMHYLCYAEASDADPAQYQFAQVDFSERHLLRWVPDFAEKTGKANRGDLYPRVMAALGEFIIADHAWQSGTISEAAEH